MKNRIVKTYTQPEYTTFCDVCNKDITKTFKYLCSSCGKDICDAHMHLRNTYIRGSYTVQMGITYYFCTPCNELLLNEIDSPLKRLQDLRKQRDILNNEMTTLDDSISKVVEHVIKTKKYIQASQPKQEPIIHENYVTLRQRINNIIKSRKNKNG